MTQQAYEQTVKQQEHIESLLTKESYIKWLDRFSSEDIGAIIESGLSLRDEYLEEHGLPLDSIIKGL